MQAALIPAEVSATHRPQIWRARYEDGARVPRRRGLNSILTPGGDELRVHQPRHQRSVFAATRTTNIHSSRHLCDARREEAACAIMVVGITRSRGAQGREMRRALCQPGRS